MMNNSTLSSTRIALTWGDCGENHAGNQQVGEIQKSGTGVTLADLAGVQAHYQAKGGVAELKVFTVPDECPAKIEAGVLILRNFLSQEEQLAMMSELTSKTWDTKFLNTRTGKVLNKHARSNLIFQRGVTQVAAYEEGKGTIEDINSMPHLASADRKVREISQLIAGLDTPTQNCDLICEGNRYRTETTKKSDQQGIGYHGDSERTRVFALSIGGYNYPMQWVLFHRYCPMAAPERVLLNSGDLYIMSELAVGQHWNKSSLWTWRHAAGHPKYLSLDRYLKAAAERKAKKEAKKQAKLKFKVKTKPKKKLKLVEQYS